jgi:hypothetical protein
MANKSGNTDTDMGLNDILKEMEKLKDMTVKVGIPEGGGDNEGVSIAQYASWNELGVMKKGGGGWHIPPRPFIRTTIDSKREKIQQVIDFSVRKVQSGKADAVTALGLLGHTVVGLVKSTLKNGSWVPNSAATRRKKGSSKPLIDNGTLHQEIQYVIRENSSEVDRGK